MKNYISVLLCLFITSQLSGQGIEFYQGTWKEALAEAKKTDKIIFVDAYAKWCGPCKRMAREVFTKKKVGAFFNENFINLKLDMEISDGMSFGQKYPVSAFPTLFFLDVDGEILKKVVGGQSDVGLLELAKSAIKSYDRSGDFATKYEAGNRDHEMVTGYIAALNQVDKPSLKIANDFWKTEHGMTREQSARFLMESVQEADSRLFDALVDHKKEAIKFSSEEEFEETIEKASLETVKKAVEYDYKELLEEAIAKYNSASVGDKNKFKYQANMQYYKMSGNFDAWKKEASAFLKKYGKKDTRLYNKQIQTLRNEFKYHDEALDYAIDVAREMVKKNDSGDNSFLYVQLLLAGQQFTEAQKYVDVAIKKAKSRDEDFTRFERIKAYLDTI